MTILYACARFDYGQPEWGPGYEHNNFYHSLVSMGHDILYFDILKLTGLHGRKRMHCRLAEVIRSEKPDLMFSSIGGEELDKKTVRNISAGGQTVTLNWFADDHWRFDSFSKPWAPCFNWIVTTSRDALNRYREGRQNNVIKSQWACNHFLYRKMDLPLKYDVSFVGRPYGNRREIIRSIEQRGLRVNTWGRDWKTGRISQEEMIWIFNQSRINLNLSNAGATEENIANSPGRLPVRCAATVLSVLPFGRQIKIVGKRLLGHAAAPATGKDLARPVSYPEQVKGRNFEIPGCGGFLLTNKLPELDQYYLDGREIACFRTTEELIDKARYYLRHENERAAIARSGYDRTLKEHTYVRRFNEIFHQAGLPFEPDPADDVLKARPGKTIEII